MKELSLNLLDIAQNSVTANAKNITVEVLESEKQDTVEIVIADDGCGMSPEFLEKVCDPFTTTRMTRKVGMGVPFFKLAAEQTGGSFLIDSTLGKGTTVRARFCPSHIDMMPLGDLTGTILTLIQGNPDINFIYHRRTDKGGYTLRTSELKEALGDVSLNEPEVLGWIREYIEENEMTNC